MSSCNVIWGLICQISFFQVSPAKVKKSPTATVMADQPLLSKMMGEVGHATIGPPPPSSAEAKSMKKKAMKQAKEAAKMAESHILVGVAYLPLCQQMAKF